MIVEGLACSALDEAPDSAYWNESLKHLLDELKFFLLQSSGGELDLIRRSFCMPRVAHVAWHWIGKEPAMVLSAVVDS